MRWLVVLVFLVPLAAGSDDTEEAVPFDLYAHLLGGEDFAMNLMPPPEAFDLAAESALLPAVTCVEGAPGPGRAGSTWSGHLVAGRYDLAYDPSVRVDYERGVPGPLEFTGEGMVLHWFVETRQEAPIVPRVVLDVSLHDGHGPGDASGPVLAEGRTQPADLSPSMGPHPDVTHHEVDGRHVYAFEVLLRVLGGVVTQESGTTLQVQASMDVPACPGAMPGGVAPHSSPGFRPRLHGEVMDAFGAGLAARFEGPDVRFSGNVQSPWGAYDLGYLRLVVAGGRTVVEPDLDVSWNDSVSWTARVPVADLPEGQYKALLRAENLHATAEASQTVGFDTRTREVWPEGVLRERPVPWPTVTVALAALAAARRLG